MPGYKVGDAVRILPLHPGWVGDDYPGVFVSDMYKHAGEIRHIRAIRPDMYTSDYHRSLPGYVNSLLYYMEEDSYCWVESEFEFAEFPNQQNISIF